MVYRWGQTFVPRKNWVSGLGTGLGIIPKTQTQNPKIFIPKPKTQNLKIFIPEPKNLPKFSHGKKLKIVKKEN